MDFNRKLFVQENEDLKCAVCWQMYDNPVQTKCGHIFCRGCINHWLRNGSGLCPLCNRSLPTSIRKKANSDITETLDSLDVYCAFHQNGCLEVMHARDYDDHIKCCKYASVMCFVKKCKYVGLRKDIGEHFECAHNDLVEELDCKPETKSILNLTKCIVYMLAIRLIIGIFMESLS